jgi:hypothetical protein
MYAQTDLVELSTINIATREREVFSLIEPRKDPSKLLCPSPGRFSVATIAFPGDCGAA